MKTKEWEEVASEETGDGGHPGSQYAITSFALLQRGDRWRVTVEQEWGANQGHLESHGENNTEGRGDSPEEACEAVRKDIFAWCDGDEKQRAEYATALRKLCYAAEDAVDN